MPSDRRLAALRALAERPGTEAEGALAREILAKLEVVPRTEESPLTAYRRWLRKEITLDDFLKAMTPDLTPEERAVIDQQEMRAAIKSRFDKGDQVYFNSRHYPRNHPGVFVDTSYEHECVMVKFDGAQYPVRVPAHSKLGWHLSRAPLSDQEAERLRR